MTTWRQDATTSPTMACSERLPVWMPVNALDSSQNLLQRNKQKPGACGRALVVVHHVV